MPSSTASQKFVLAAWLMSSFLVAQEPFADLARRGLPRDLQSVTSAVFGDVDGDGDVDLVQGVDALFPSGGLRLLRNDGSGHYEASAQNAIPAVIMSPTGLALGDVDADGDLDLVVGNRSNLQNLLLINDGTGRFTDVTATDFPAVLDDTRAIEFVDVDADGDLDLVVANDWQADLVLINDGTGKFTAGVALPSPVVDQSLDIGTGDFDGDGDVDLVVANGGGQNRLLFNDGTGKFVDMTGPNLPRDLDPSTSVVSVDIDADGDLDLVFGNYETPGLKYLNDGSGKFTRVASLALAAFSPVVSACVVDLDGDQDSDIVLGMWGAVNRLLINDGQGIFTVGMLEPGEDPTEVVLSADIDRDGDLDLFVGNSFSVFVPSRSRLYINDAGVFVDSAEAYMPVDTDDSEAVVLGDLNGDGHMDMVVANNDSRNRVYVGRFGGFFDDVTLGSLPADRDRSRALVLGDVDADGDLDLIVGNELQDRLYLNDGTGKFSDVTSTYMPSLIGDTRDCELGDLDGDGDLDLILANRGKSQSFSQQNRICLNDGTGHFRDVTATNFPPFLDFTEALSLGDVDGDGDLDIVFGNRDSGLPSFPQFNRLLHNDGTGKFQDVSATRMPLIVVPTTDLALVDVDGDGDLDLVLSNWTRPDSLYINDNGRFRNLNQGRFPTVFDQSHSVAVGDIDEDGDPDLLFGLTGGSDAIYWNDGSGRFKAAASSPFPRRATLDVALVDVDADGDLDCVSVHGRREQNQVFLNTRRQLDVPYIPILGGALRLEIHARPVPGGSARAALPWIGLLPAAAPILVPPFGHFTIDPGTMFTLQAIVIPANQDRAVSSLAIPAIGTLAGLKILGQAIVWHGGANFGRVTNTVSTTIHR